MSKDDDLLFINYINYFDGDDLYIDEFLALNTSPRLPGESGSGGGFQPTDLTTESGVPTTMPEGGALPTITEEGTNGIGEGGITLPSKESGGGEYK